MVSVGNRVVFDQDQQGNSCSYVEHKATGNKTKIEQRHGGFQFTIKVPKSGRLVQEVQEDLTGMPDFIRQGLMQADLFY